MLSSFFLKHPEFAKVVSILITVLGLLALYKLPVAQFPNVAPPMITITANYTGGNPEAVEKYVTIPIEQQLLGVQGMMYMDSYSSANGVAQINVYFEPGYSIDQAASDVQIRVNLATPQLPEIVNKNGVQIEKSTPNMVQIITLTSDDPNHDALYLNNFAKINLVNELKRLPGVGKAMLYGNLVFSMRIWLDTDKMASAAIAPQDVINAIETQNVNSSGGQIGAPPMPSTNKEYLIVNVQSRINDVEQFENIVVRANRDGSLLKIKDIGRVELGAQDYSVVSQLNNQDTALVAVFQAPNGNSLQIAGEVDDLLKKLESRWPADIHAFPTYDTTTYIKLSIHEVIITLLIALVLVILVTYIFLQDWRATLIPTIAIPVSIIGTFTLMYLFGFTINTLSLFGIILAIAVVVDDGIIVIENVKRNLMEDPELSIMQACQKAMKEVSTAVIATTLVLFAILIPVAFIPGLTGALYQQFALTQAMAVGISAFNALTLSPTLAVILLKKGESAESRFILFRWFNSAFEFFRRIYIGILKRNVKHWYIIGIVFLLASAVTVALLKMMPSGFIPEEDEGYAMVSIQLEPGSSLESTTKVSREVTSKILTIPGVENSITIFGYSMMTGQFDVSAGAMFVGLKPFRERTTPDLSAKAIMSRITEVTADMDNIQVMTFGVPPIPGFANLSGFQFQMQNYMFKSIHDMYELAMEFSEAASRNSSLLFAMPAINVSYPYVDVEVDREKAMSLGIALNDLFLTLQSALGGYFVNYFDKYGQVFDVYVQAESKYRSQQKDITDLYVKNSEGVMIPVSAIATLKRSSGPSFIEHYNGYRTVSFFGVQNYYNGTTLNGAIKAMEEISDKVLPNSFGYEWTGIALQSIEAGDAAVYVFVLSLFFVFLFLVAQFESWYYPFMIMIPLPAVLAGALGLLVPYSPINNTYVQIGLVMLIGMASKNAILIVEFARQLHEQGMEIKEAAIEASRLRMRPILMTVLAFVLGVLPLAVATGVDAIARNTIGLTVIGGIIASAFFTLMLTPVLFVYIEKFRSNYVLKGEKE